MTMILSFVSHEQSIEDDDLQLVLSAFLSVCGWKISEQNWSNSKKLARSFSLRWLVTQRCRNVNLLNGLFTFFYLSFRAIDERMELFWFLFSHQTIFKNISFFHWADNCVFFFRLQALTHSFTLFWYVRRDKLVCTNSIYCLFSDVINTAFSTYVWFKLHFELSKSFICTHSSSLSQITLKIKNRFDCICSGDRHRFLFDLLYAKANIYISLNAF